jgi:hypothetical protein
MEDLVEEMLRLRGFRYERNIRLRGRSGSLHEVDFLVYTSKGPVVYEVKNLEKPVPKEVVIKTYEIARDVGASGAVVVSSSGFTESAVKVARSLGVELLDLEGLLELVEASRFHGNAIYLERRLDSEKARRLAEKMLKRKLVFLKVERLVGFKCVYTPFYYFEGNVRIGESIYRKMVAVASALSGLPLAVSGNALVEAARRAALVPLDILPLYSKLAGKIVKSSEASSLYGEARWRRLLSILESAGLAERVSRRPLKIKILDDKPRLEYIEEAASLFVAKAAHVPSRECSIVEARLSPGASRALLSGLYGFNVENEVLVYAPIYVFQAEELRRPIYRLIYITGWLGKPLVYRPAVDIKL